MEDIYFTASVVAFALAACSLVASIVIFVRADVLNAIRFLRHQPVKRGRKGGVVIPKAAPKKSRRRKAAGVPVGDDRVTAPPGADKATEAVATDAEASERPTGLLDEDSERPTGLLDVRDSEQVTDLLDDEASERLTSLLEGEGSERATDLLEEASEKPTGLLGQEPSEAAAGLLGDEMEERPAGVLDEPVPGDGDGAEDGIEPSERPTGVLAFESAENPTEVLAAYGAFSHEPAQASAVAQHEETTFRFILKHNEVVVHTQETID